MDRLSSVQKMLMSTFVFFEKNLRQGMAACVHSQWAVFPAEHFDRGHEAGASRGRHRKIPK